MRFSQIVIGFFIKSGVRRYGLFEATCRSFEVPYLQVCDAKIVIGGRRWPRLFESIEGLLKMPQFGVSQSKIGVNLRLLRALQCLYELR